MNCPTCGGELAEGRTWCSLDCYRRRRHPRRQSSVAESLAEQYPHFDLSVLSEKQQAVIEMRFGGNLSWREIAAFEGVRHQSIVDRYRSALATVADSINPDTWRLSERPISYRQPTEGVCVIERTTKLRCQAEREALGLSVSELARRIGKQPSRLSAYELGRAVPPPGSVELFDLALGLHFRGDPSLLLEPVGAEGEPRT